jgi:hypothetical protein
MMAKHIGGWILRVRVEIMGSQKCGIVGKSQSVLIMISPIIFTRARRAQSPTCPKRIAISSALSERVRVRVRVSESGGCARRRRSPRRLPRSR